MLKPLVDISFRSCQIQNANHCYTFWQDFSNWCGLSFHNKTIPDSDHAVDYAEGSCATTLLWYRNVTLGKIGVSGVFLKINRSLCHHTLERTSRDCYPVLHQNVGCNSPSVREEICDHDTQKDINIKAGVMIATPCLIGPCLGFEMGRGVIIRAVWPSRWMSQTVSGLRFSNQTVSVLRNRVTAVL